jgi:hypothetical protein
MSQFKDIKDMIDPLTGSFVLESGMYKGLHRQMWTIRDERKSGFDGGSFMGDRWIPRTFTVFDGIVGMGISLCDDNQTITMDTGIYYVDITSPALGVGCHQIRFQNITDNITEAFGTSECSSTDEHCSRSVASFHLNVKDTLIPSVTSKSFQLQHRCDGGRPGDGFGRACKFGDNNELYSVIKIYRLN